MPFFREGILRSIQERIEAGIRPDYVILSNTQGLTPRLIQYFNEKEIPHFVIYTGLTPEDAARMGSPREKYPYWIGLMAPDDEQAGYELGMYLIATAKNRWPSRSPRILAFRGANAVEASVERVRGLQRAVRTSSVAELLHVASGHWQRASAKKKYPRLRQRYGRLNIVWAASDEMALGALDCALVDGEDIVAGGFNGTTDALKSIRRGQLSASMGGHFIDIVYALALVKGFAAGRDFVDTHGVIVRSKLILFTSENIDRYSLALGSTAHLHYEYPLEILLDGPAQRDRGVSIESFLSDLHRW